MRLSEQTVSLLKNFAGINQNIQFKTGNRIQTISAQKNILVNTEVPESFPSDFAIYDLNKMLGVMSLFQDPELEIGDKTMKVGGKVNYMFADPTMIVTPPENNITVPDPEVKFKLTSDTLTQVLKAGNVLGTPEIVVEGGPHPNDTLRIKAMDVNNDSTDTFQVNLAETSDSTFRFVFRTENFKMFPGNYDVEISSKGIARFSKNQLQYWIATESSSTYGV